MFLYSPYFVVIEVMPSQKRYCWVPRRLSVTSPHFALLRLATVSCAVFKMDPPGRTLTIPDSASLTVPRYLCRRHGKDQGLQDRK